MKPLLTVEGKQYNNIDLQYRNGKLTCITAWDEDNKLLPYYNANIENHAYVEKSLLLDFDEALKWEERYQPIYDALDSFIACNQQDIQNLATEIADNVEPFVPNPKIKEREDLKQRTFGLMDAQDVIHELMEDDVDLSGGEEVDSE